MTNCYGVYLFSTLEVWSESKRKKISMTQTYRIINYSSVMGVGLLDHAVNHYRISLQCKKKVIHKNDQCCSCPCLKFLILIRIISRHYTQVFDEGTHFKYPAMVLHSIMEDAFTTKKLNNSVARFAVGFKDEFASDSKLHWLWRDRVS